MCLFLVLIPNHNLKDVSCQTNLCGRMTQEPVAFVHHMLLYALVMIVTAPF